MIHEDQIRVLQSIEQSLTNLQETLQRLVESAAKNHEAKQGEKHTRKEVDASVAALPVEVSEYYRSEQSERPVKNRRESKRFWLEVVGVLTAVALVIITLATLCVFNEQLKEAQRQTEIFKRQATQAVKDAVDTRQQAEQQIKIAKDQFTADQRPYVWLQDRPPGVAIPEIVKLADGRYAWNIFITDYGKSPAIKMCDKAWLVMGENALARVPDVSRNTCESKQEGILPPTRIQWFSGVTKDKVTDAEFTKWNSTDFGIVVYGRIDYSDSFGKQYFSQFCLAHQKNGVIANCNQHNDIQ